MWQTQEGYRLRPPGGFSSLAGICIFSLLCPSVIASDYACSVQQLSRTSDRPLGARAMALSGDGRQALILTRAFVGSAPIPTTPELFLVDLEDGQWTQLTQTLENTFSGEITADADLHRIVFVSRQDVTGENPSHSSQVFLLTRENLRIRQLTSFSGDTTRILSPRISGDGSTLAFLANANPLGTNRDSSRELFVISLVPRELRQISRLSQVSIPSEPSLSFDGSRLAFLVTHSLSGFAEIDIVDLENGEVQLVYTAPRIASPMLTARGDQLFFVTDIDPEGTNLDRSLEIFKIELDPADGEPRVTDQLSSFPGIGGSSFDNLTVSSDGKRIVFRSQLNLADWDGQGADNIYLYEVADSRLQQITRLRGFNEPATRFFADHKGKRILFSSGADLTGQNGDGNFETFLAACHQVNLFYFPQIGDGQAGEIRFRTSFVLANTGPDSSVQIDFFTSRGGPLEVDLKGLGRRQSVTLDIPRGTPLILETRGVQPLQVGFARIRSSESISASAVFTGSLANTDTTLYEAAVPMTKLLSEFSVVVNTLGHFQTGLAMVNPPQSGFALAGSAGNPADAELLIRLYDNDFNLLGQKELLLPPGRHSSQFVSQLFAEVPRVREMVGLLTVRSSHPLAVVTLRLRDDPNRNFPADVPTLTTLPIAPGIPETTVAKNARPPVP